ncbi:MAG: glycoside hydrolase [Opitutaceae bacterium]|jgi:sialidase-1|nr:glycoside hydrolase [Opitutaceae bacterium]
MKTPHRLPLIKTCLLVLTALPGLQLPADSLPRPGQWLHLDAGSAAVSKDGAVITLLDRGPLKLDVPARDKAKGFGGVLNKSALNGQNTITIHNGGFMLDAAKAAPLNASEKGVTIVLVAKIGPAAGNIDLVKKQGPTPVKDAGYSIRFSTKTNQVFLWAVSDEANRISYGRQPQLLPAPKDWFVIVMSADIPANKFEAAFNGRPLSKPFVRGKLSALAADAPLEIGAGAAGGMEFAELAIYDRPLTAGERKQISDSLSAKYGIGPAAFATSAKLEEFLGQPVFVPPQKLWEGRGGWGGTVAARDGAIIVFRSPGGGVCRRSLDGGRTWGPDIEIAPDAKGGRALVDENTGDILFVEPTQGWLFRSRDSGAAWTRETCEARPDGFGLLPGNEGVAAMQAGITLAFGDRKGRLLMPARVMGPKNTNAVPWRPYHYNTAFHSDDGGKVWRLGKPFPLMGTGEAALAELSDGSILYNSREHMSDGNRFFAWSHDGGELWLNVSRSPDLPDGPRGNPYGCMGGMIRLPIGGRDILLYSNLDSGAGTMPDQVGASIISGRKNATVWASFDGGRTWPVKRLVYAGPAGYSNLGVGRSGTPSQGLVFLNFEGGVETDREFVHVAAFNLSWLLDGRAVP